MAIHHKEIEHALKAHDEWIKTATKEEMLAFLMKCNPPIPGLDLPYEEMKYKERKAKAKKPNRRKIASHIVVVQVGLSYVW
jgi:hypothetical protein